MCIALYGVVRFFAQTGGFVVAIWVIINAICVKICNFAR
jgi:hypothetical protein